MSLTIAECGAVTLSHTRKNVCLESAFELEVLAQMLPGLVPNTEETNGAHYAVRGIAARILSLSQVLMTSVFDEGEETKDLERTVFVSDPNVGG